MVIAFVLEFAIANLDGLVLSATHQSAQTTARIVVAVFRLSSAIAWRDIPDMTAASGDAHMTAPTMARAHQHSRATATMVGLDLPAIRQIVYTIVLEMDCAQSQEFATASLGGLEPFARFRFLLCCAVHPFQLTSTFPTQTFPPPFPMV